MSRKIILFIAVSVDGFIAKQNGAVDWLVGHEEGDNSEHGYEAFYDTIDTVVMGRTTFEQIIHELSPDKWVYEGKRCIVGTSKRNMKDSRVEFVSEDLPGLIQSLKKEQGKDIWIVGGGKLINPFIKENLIDKYIITIIPTLLGEGIPLFLHENPEIKLRLIETKTFNGIVELTYERKESICKKKKMHFHN